MNIFWAFTKKMLWDLFRITLMMVRSVFWYFNGVYTKLEARKKTDAYKGTAHIKHILFRHKVDMLLEKSDENAIFISTHCCFDDPECVLKKNVTLFYVTTEEATFVETDPEVDIRHSDTAAFIRMAQYEHATRVITLPIHVFHKVCDTLTSPPDKNIIFLLNTARCGSTLLSQVFEQTEECVSWSEPDAFNALTHLHSTLPEQEVDKIMYNTIKIMCQPTSEKSQMYLLKATAPSICLTGQLYKHFPGAKYIFMYRESWPTVKSLDRACYQMPLLNLLVYLAQISGKFVRKILEEDMGLDSKPYERKIQSRLHFMSIVWASTMYQYNEFRKNGVPIVAAKYEDIVEDQDYAFSKIFEFVDLPYNSEAVTKAMGRDSQRGSMLNKQALASQPQAVFDDRSREAVTEVCRGYGLPPVPEPYDAPGTITKKP